MIELTQKQLVALFDELNGTTMAMCVALEKVFGREVEEDEVNLEPLWDMNLIQCLGCGWWSDDVADTLGCPQHAGDDFCNSCVEGCKHCEL